MLTKVSETSKKIFLLATALFVTAFCVSVFAYLFNLVFLRSFISKPIFSIVMGVDVVVLSTSFIVWLLSKALIKFNLKDKTVYDSNKEQRKLGILVMIIWVIVLVLFIGMNNYSKTHTLLPILPKVAFGILFILFPVILILIGNRIVKTIGKGILILFVILLIGSQTLFSPHKIKGLIMFPTIANNDYVLSRKYIFDSPKRGDIVIYNQGSGDFISRIIGLPGENVVFQDNKIFINGRVLNEDYLSNSLGRSFDLQNERVTINLNSNQFVLIGDNYPRGVNKGNIVKVSIEKIKSKIWYRYWPTATKGIIK